MIRELWNAFPRLLEQKINALLESAEPTPAKAFQLYKTCQYENLWHESFEKFSSQLNQFFAIPKLERRKADLDAILDCPIRMDTFEAFQLDFRNSLIDNREMVNIASWAHHLIRVSQKTNSLVISEDVFTKTLHYITHPPLFEKAMDITFEDFCDAWKKTVFKLFGRQYDKDLEHILSELRWLNTQLKLQEATDPASPFCPTIYLTQTEIDWTTDVLRAVSDCKDVPKFPLSRGPQKQRLMDLERACRLYKIVQTTKLPELIKHRDNIRATIIDRCESLLRERAR